MSNILVGVSLDKTIIEEIDKQVGPWTKTNGVRGGRADWIRQLVYEHLGKTPKASWHERGRRSAVPTNSECIR